MRIFAAAAALVLPLAACFMPHPDAGPGASTPGADSATLNKAGVGSKSSSEPTGLKPAAVDTTKRFEYVDLYVTMGNADDQRKLAPYILTSEVWSIDKFEQLSDTLRHYRFRRMVSQDGKSMPEVNPLAPRP